MKLKKRPFTFLTRDQLRQILNKYDCDFYVHDTECILIQNHYKYPDRIPISGEIMLTYKYSCREEFYIERFVSFIIKNKDILDHRGKEKLVNDLLFETYFASPVERAKVWRLN